MRIAYDMSSFMWTALFAGKDTEFGFAAPDPKNRDKKVWINTWRYGYENIINMMVAALKQFNLAPIDALLVFEGMHAKNKRRFIEGTYKEGDTKSPENYVEFEALRAKMKEVWLGLGATCVEQDYVEGDDILAYLAEETEQDLVVATNDGDMTVLNGANAHGAKILVRCGDKQIGQNPYGPWDIRLIPVYKALVGDTGDKIKGVVGFGGQKWIDFIATYGEEGLFEVQARLERDKKLGDMHTQVEDCKLIKMICEQEAQCLRSYQLGRLHPEWVNTMVNPLRFTAGMVREAPKEMPDERLSQWYQKKVLITGDMTTQLKTRLLNLVQESPFVAFDIETSTPEESDEWIDRQSKSDDGDDRAVDVYGSELTGFSITCGRNLQHTFYFPVAHHDSDNIPLEQARWVIELAASFGKRTVVQNASFELAVCYRTFAEQWVDNGYEGFLPDIDDTKFMSSYVDENNPLGLKWRSENVLGYRQVTYDEVTKVTRALGQMWPGGTLLREWEQEVEAGLTVGFEERRYKMRDLPAAHVFDYGCDDTICTAALYVYNRLIMEIEHTWKVYREVEIDACYQHAVNFECGIAFSVEKSNELAKLDDQTYDDAWKVVRQFLIDMQYEGTLPPEFEYPLSSADIKIAFEACFQRPLKCMARLMDKIISYLQLVENEPTFALLLGEICIAAPEDRPARMAAFNDYIASHFKGEPESPIGSPKKMQYLLFEMMKLPVRVRNKVTDKMKLAGVFEGTPKTDALAIEYALQMDATPEYKAVLEAMKLMQMVRTRRSLYYSKWPNFMHWKDGMVRPSHNQCATNTRRASESAPNKQQLPKHQKIEDQPARFRETIIPHARNAVVVSMDFEAQELRIIAHWSRDENLVACYVGSNKKDVHALTGLGIFNYKGRKRGVEQITYEQFEEIRAAGNKMDPLFQFVKDDRNLGKKVNFTTEFGAMAPKVAQTLLISEEDAQAFIDTREATFPGVKAWKEAVISETKEKGFVLTMMGARRHLRPALTSGNSWLASKAERQGVNTKVQGSAAEQTKLAEGRMWKDRLFFDFDALCYGPVHDEICCSVLIKDLHVFLPRMHAAMIGDFANMSIPIGSSISFGWDFYNQHELGNQPSKEAIDRGIALLYAKQ